MAEIALIASIVQIADTGYRLSLKLYTSGEAISSADRTIITISKDISLTSTVLKELGEILSRDQDEKERICSENLVQTAGNTVKECLDAFEELDSMILKNMPNLSQGHRATRATMALERLKWPFIQPRIQLLRGSLDMLRANISLMLNVLIYARHVSDRKKSRAPAPGVYDEARQKTIIEELVNAKDEYVRKFESLKLSIPASPSTQTVHNIGNRAAPAHTEGNVVPTQRICNTLPATTFQNPPAPQHTLNPFSANTFQNTPASQWPLPNIPASYPIMPTDPVTVQPEQHSSWQLFCHLDNLVKSLVREVYSPGYQIPAESRSRFTGVIRATHTTEIVEAERREPSKYSESGTFHSFLSPMTPQGPSNLFMANQDPSPYSSQKPLPMQHCFAPANEMLIRKDLYRHVRSTTSPSVSYVKSGDEQGKREEFYRMQALGAKRRDPGRDKEQPAIKRSRYDTAEDSFLSSDLSRDENKPRKTSCYFRYPTKIREPERNDIVDDLVKLWTLVR